MIDEIDYFQKRDKFKKKKGLGLDEDWDALKKKRSAPDSKSPPADKPDKKSPPSSPPAARKKPSKS